MNALIVIDMQHKFLVAGHRSYLSCIDSVKQQILKAKQNNDHVVFVEFVSNNPLQCGWFKKYSGNDTLNTLKEIVFGYDKVLFVEKTINDGGKEICQAFKAKRIKPAEIKVAGIYADACVKATVETLSKRLKDTKISILKNSVCAYGGNRSNKKIALQEMSQLENVAVV